MTVKWLSVSSNDSNSICWWTLFVMSCFTGRPLVWKTWKC